MANVRIHIDGLIRIDLTAPIDGKYEKLRKLREIATDLRLSVMIEEEPEKRRPSGRLRHNQEKMLQWITQHPGQRLTDLLRLSGQVESGSAATNRWSSVVTSLEKRGLIRKMVNPENRTQFLLYPEIQEPFT